MSRFDRVILAVVLAVGLSVALLAVASARIGPTVDRLSLAPTLDGTSVNTLIGVTFTQPMDVVATERSFHLSPHVPGSFNWVGNELLYLPRHSLRYGTRYAVTVDRGARSRAGRHLFKRFHATFTTQLQHLLYLGTQGSERHRLVLASVAGRQEVVGGSNITDFSVSFDGASAVYTRRDIPSGHSDEIWLLSLADNSAQLLLHRPGWDISQPHLSPDGRYVVFLASNVVLCRTGYGCFRDTSAPIIYLYDLHSHRAGPFHPATASPIDNQVQFSPAGQVAYTDSGSALTLADPTGGQVVHIPYGADSLLFAGLDSRGDKAVFVGQTPSSSGGEILIYLHGKYQDISHGTYDSATPSFSSASNKVAYAAYRREQGIEPVYGINIYDLSSHHTRRLDEQAGWSDWSPRWSPDDHYIAYIRSRPREAMYMGAGVVCIVRSTGGAVRELGVGEDVRWIQ